MLQGFVLIYTNPFFLFYYQLEKYSKLWYNKIRLLWGILYER